ncbi:DNA cytosine methyltransferase [Agrobacterium rubi]|nr:DNA cytosine methyltransferase [Agrobacterium rubi]NTF24408.1 DNA cytosine methyltransferase [Agrobacterium rubi]
MSDRPVCVDLFAGVGGMSLGFEQAGFDVACAVEIDAVHSAAHRFNFPHSPVLCDSVENLDGATIRERAGLGDRQVSVVIGGPPCQGFSLIGKRVLDDERNGLVRHFLRLVCELDASYFVMENVKGLTLGPQRQVLDELVEEFGAVGYDVVTPWKVLNASWFGVPQHRERLFLIGAKRGLALPSYPAAKTNPAGRKEVFRGLETGPSVMEAIGDLPDAESFDVLRGTDSVETALGEPSAFARSMRGLSRDSDDFSYPRDWDSSLMTSSARADHTLQTRQRFAATVPGKVEPTSRFLKLDPNGICNTLRAGTDEKRGAYTAARPIHPVHPRCITVREMARLHGYPDWFRCNWTKWHGAREVGNSVPPRLARAVGGAITKAMSYAPQVPRHAIDLGDEKLVKVDRSEAVQIMTSTSY